MGGGRGRGGGRERERERERGGEEEGEDNAVDVMKGETERHISHVCKVYVTKCVNVTLFWTRH